jgi:RNA polymerase sigma factor (sigma-70 family)
LSTVDFASFFRARFSRTVVLLVTMGASQADADDAAQEAMLEALVHWDEIDEPAPWLRTVALRKYWALARRRKPEVSLDEAAADHATDSDLGIFADEEQQVLRALRQLPPQQRTVTALFYDGMETREIAELAGMSPATVRSHLRHARMALKGLLESKVVLPGMSVLSD